MQHDITWQHQLADEGYCVVPSILSDDMLARLRQRFSDAALAQTPKENFGESGGFVVADYHDPTLVDVLTWPKTIQTLQAAGFAAPKLHNFYISAKPPHAAALPWHSDLFYEYDQPQPAELFLIYYLQDTSPENGCLRVVPGSHRWPHAKRHQQPANAQTLTGEADVPVRAGDLFIGDRRILHATHPNATDTWRTCLTIAYAPLFDQLPEPVQALIVQNRCLPPRGWWQSDEAHMIDPRLQAILPIYRGHAKPVPLA